MNVSDSKIDNKFYALRRNGSKLLKRLHKTAKLEANIKGGSSGQLDMLLD